MLVGVAFATSRILSSASSFKPNGGEAQPMSTWSVITAVSVAWLDESIGLYKAVGLGVMIAGILLIKSGTRNASGTPAQPRGEAVTC